MAEAKLIEKHEVERQQAALEKHKLKLGSSRHIQRGGVIRVGDARAQLTQRDAEEWQKEANKDVVNMAEQRAQRQLFWSKRRRLGRLLRSWKRSSELLSKLQNGRSKIYGRKQSN